MRLTAVPRDRYLALRDYLYTQLVVNGKRSLLIDDALSVKFNVWAWEARECVYSIMLENNIDRIDLVIVRVA
jgi:hypothetical protein